MPESKGDLIYYRTVAGWLFHFAAAVEGFAVSHALAGDETGAAKLTECARDIQRTASRLDSQGGIIRDVEYLVILLQQARCYVASSISDVPPRSGQFMSAQEVLDGIDRHAKQ